MDVQDPLKPFDLITRPDPRHNGSLDTLEGLHANLDTIRLHIGVSLHVRQLFETAKNLSLYSWVVFRFHPIAQLVGYASLERALKERVAMEPHVDVDLVRTPFSRLMKTALERGWLRSEGFDVAHQVARAQLQDEQTIKMVESGLIGDEPVESPEIGEANILSRAAELDVADRLAKAFPLLRNHIAHGGPALRGGSAGTLRTLSEAINQLFEEPTFVPKLVPDGDT